ncbi:type II toxin-antitoxin system VapC family toxin [Candidatus Albibeggiatoa sp. nov. BB20]|uniref:type II toxin-antitoxin system VapC family toxin n=1 Tax=Candidatus Albibeggiatoa sp. nov. BB20 TaxID=3162723 RepID=UPI003365774A
MKYLLDTNTVSDFYNCAATHHEAILQHFTLLKNTDELYISVLSLYEIGYGLANAPENKKTQIHNQLDRMSQDFELLPLLPQSAALFGQLKKQLQDNRALNSKHMKKHNIDLMLATTAITTGCTLVSADKGFIELQGLHVDLYLENWSND